MAGLAEVVSAVGTIINVERFSYPETMLQETTCVLRFCRRLFGRLKRKIDKLIGVDDVMKETSLTVDELLDAKSCWVKYEQTLMSSEIVKFEKRKGSLNMFDNKSGLFRSGTRIERCLKLNCISVNPILLRKESHLTKLIVLYSHKKYISYSFIKHFCQCTLKLLDY